MLNKILKNFSLLNKKKNTNSITNLFFIYLNRPFLIILISILIQTITPLTQNLCNLKIADTLMSSFNGNDIIYNFGKIDEIRFGKDALTPYRAPFNKEIDFFYATEIHGVELKKSHEDVV
jgi:hypothetical protein